MGTGRGSLFKKGLALFFFAAIAATIVAVCVVYVPKKHDDAPGSKIKVQNKAAFEHGGASQNPTKGDDGKGKGEDQYTYYTGKADTFPKKDDWVSFDDMWDANQVLIKTACSDHQWGDDNSDEETAAIKNGIKSVAKNSLVDHRLILAVIIQESKGCVRVQSSSNGVHNPGLMQSHNGSSYDPKHDKHSIRQMIQDGTQGTSHGDGLVQVLDKFGNAYAAARGYNSGDVAESGNLSEAIGATSCYASDIANRLTGWVKAPTKCEAEVEAEADEAESWDQQQSSPDQQSPSDQQSSPDQQSSSPTTESSDSSQQGSEAGYWGIDGLWHGDGDAPGSGSGSWSAESGNGGGGGQQWRRLKKSRRNIRNNLA